MPRKNFMIERHGKAFGQPCWDYAKISYKDNVVSEETMKIRWVDWEGTRYVSAAEAQFAIDNTPELLRCNAKVIEILGEVRVTMRDGRKLREEWR